MTGFNPKLTGGEGAGTSTKQVTRAEKGRFAPGVSGNPHGKRKGTLNSTTKEAMRHAAADAAKWYRELAQTAADPRTEPHLRAQLQVRLLELGYKAPEDCKEPATEWMSEKELRFFLKLLQRATNRRDRGEDKAARNVPPREPWTEIPAPASEAVIDVAAEPDELVIDLEPTR
jgi:hypothetical protein